MMGQLSVTLEQSQTGTEKRGKVTIKNVGTGVILAEETQSFPLTDANEYITEVLLEKIKALTRRLMLKRLPTTFTFSIDETVLTLRRFLDL